MTLEIVPASDCSVLLRFTSGNAEETQDWILRLLRRLQRRPAPGQMGVGPGDGSLLVRFRIGQSSHDAVEDHLLQLLEDEEAAETLPRSLVIPVLYDGPDRDEAASVLSISPGSLVELHAAARYRAAFLGFLPGFAYLRGPVALKIPRRSAGRRVHGGEVAIAAGYTSIYPAECSGTWWVLGRTPVKPFDLARPDPLWIHPGDEVRFQPVSAAEYARAGGQL